MADLGKMINETLDQAERDLRTQIRGEPGFIDQILGVFGGGTGWVHSVMIVVQTLLFLLGAWAAWTFFLADEPTIQIRMGLPAAVLLLMAVMIKSMVWSTVQTNRVLRELKRIELQLSRGNVPTNTRG